MEWNKIQSTPPPEGTLVNTKISDKDGERNFQKMKFKNKLWFTDDGIYVYYTPTHWAYAEIDYSNTDYRTRIW